MKSTKIEKNHFCQFYTHKNHKKIHLKLNECILLRNRKFEPTVCVNDSPGTVYTLSIRSARIDQDFQSCHPPKDQRS